MRPGTRSRSTENKAGTGQLCRGLSRAYTDGQGKCNAEKGIGGRVQEMNMKSIGCNYITFSWLPVVQRLEGRICDGSG